MDSAAAADAPKPSAVDYDALSAAELVAALRSGDVEAQCAAATVVEECFREHGKMSEELAADGVALSCSLAWSDDHKDLICADGCERFWAIVRRNSKAAGDFNPAAAAIELLSDILYSAEQLGDWGYNVEQNGTALVTIVSEHAAFSSECVAAAANLVLKITCIAHELRFGETAIPIRNILKDLSTCLLRFRVEDDNDRTDALLDGLCDFIQTDAPVGYLDVRASGVLAAAVSCLATGTERLQSYTAYAAAKLVHATYTLAPRGSQHLI